MATSIDVILRQSKMKIKNRAGLECSFNDSPSLAPGALKNGSHHLKSSSLNYAAFDATSKSLASISVINFVALLIAPAPFA